MKKILYMTMLWGYGGIEKYMLNIFDHIDRTEFPFDVALPGLHKQQNEDALINRGINVIHYQATSLSQQIREVKRILDAGDYDIVHVMQSYVTLETYAVFALVAISEQKHHHYKVICHSHGTENKTKSVNPIKKMMRSAYRTLLRKGFSRADMLVGCSKEACGFLYGVDADFTIFYNGIDLDRFTKKYTGEELLSIKEKYNIVEGKPKFVTVARMCDDKNPLFLIEIIKQLLDFYPNLSFTWVGDGEFRDGIESEVKKSGISDHVRLLGTQEQVSKIVSCCDYFLLPSKIEGAPLVLIEAQAVGLRCFASDRVPNIIDCGGVSFIELDKTPEEWADEIHRQIESEPKAKVNMDLLKRFDINETVKTLSHVYNDLAEKK